MEIIAYILLEYYNILDSPLKQQILGKCIELNVQAIELLDASPLIGAQIEDCSSGNCCIVLLKGYGKAQIEGLFEYILGHLQCKRKYEYNITVIDHFWHLYLLIFRQSEIGHGSQITLGAREHNAIALVRWHR